MVDAIVSLIEVVLYMTTSEAPILPILYSVQAYSGYLWVVITLVENTFMTAS